LAACHVRLLAFRDGAASFPHGQVGRASVFFCVAAAGLDHLTRRGDVLSCK
jgi:hypothetical protein